MGVNFKGSRIEFTMEGCVSDTIGCVGVMNGKDGCVADIRRYNNCSSLSMTFICII